MNLLLLRHAKTHSLNGQKVLSPEGGQQAQGVAHYLSQQAIDPCVILHSPIARAKQTAEVIAQDLDISFIQAQNWLSPGCHWQVLLKELAVYQSLKNVMLVGHEPDLSCLIEAIMGIEYGAIKIKKGSLAYLQGLTPPSRGGTLRWLYEPKTA